MAKQIVTFETTDGRVFKSEVEADTHEAGIAITEVMMAANVDFDTVLMVSEIFIKNAEPLAKALAPLCPGLVQKIAPVAQAAVLQPQPQFDEQDAQAPQPSEQPQTSGGVPVAPDRVPGTTRKWGQVPRAQPGAGLGVTQGGVLNGGDGNYVNADGSVSRVVG